MLHTFDTAIFSDNPAFIREPAMPSDEQLMASIHTRDESALAQFYRRHRSLIYSVVSRVVNDMHHAEDLVQEVFVQLWDEASKYSPTKGKALGWLITLARRRAIDKVRRIQSYQRAQERF